MAAFARTAGFYALVLFIVVFSVFPFYYAIVTSFKSGTDLFRVDTFREASRWPITKASSTTASSCRTC